MIYDITSYNITLMQMYFMASIYLILSNNNIIRTDLLYEGIVIILILFIFNDIVFLRKKKYLEIIKMFENETKKEKLISSAIVIGMFIFNALLFVYSLWNL